MNKKDQLGKNLKKKLFEEFKEELLKEFWEDIKETKSLLMRQQGNPRRETGCSVTLDAYIETFMQTKVNTSKNHQNKLRYALKWISKSWGSRILSDITRKDCQELVNQLENEKAQETCKTYKATYTEMFKLAKLDGLIENNPFEQIKLHKRGKKEYRNATDEEIQKLIIAASNHRFWFVPIILVMAGLRREELCGLMKEDIAISDDGTISIRINKAYVCVGGVSEWKETKTESSNRTVVFQDKKTAKKLKKYLDELNSSYLMPQTRDNNKPTSPDTFSKRIFNPWQQKAGINIKGMHTLRHSYATHCLACGMNIETLRQQMGHTEVTQTLEYARQRGLSEAGFAEVCKTTQAMSKMMILRPEKRTKKERASVAS